jgi:hypothetical protein
VARKRLRIFLLLMLAIAVANGLVNTVQLNMTPAQLSTWGPGYKYRIEGNGTGLNSVSGREFETAAGVSRTRPFGLGDDIGVGALWGMLALGGAIALLSTGPGRRTWWLALLFAIGPPLAVITGEGRSILVSSIVALFAYIAFATTARKLISTLAAVFVALALVVGVVAYISSVSGAGVFDRYATITPSKIASTTSTDRGGSLSAIPKIIEKHPLGNGLGGVGPASKFAGGGVTGSNGETEPGFLVSELGVPGLIVLYGFNLQLLILGARRIKLFDTEIRTYLAALLAGLVGLLVIGISAATTSTSPASAYLWFTGGVLSYWLVTVPSQRSRTKAPVLESAVEPPFARRRSHNIRPRVRYLRFDERWLGRGGARDERGSRSPRA